MPKEFFSFKSLILLFSAIALLYPSFSNYIGSGLVYLFFLIASLSVLSIVLKAQTGIGQKIFCIFLLLGFTLKFLMIFTFVDNNFLEESVGSFEFTAESWDRLLLLVSVAYLAVVLGSFVFKFVGGNNYKYLAEVKVNVPRVYAENRRLFWVLGVLGILFTSLFNYYFGIHQIGLAPRKIFIWPTNAIVAWMLNIGFCSLLCVMVWWDILLNKLAKLQVFSFILEAMLTSVSTMSRSIFIFHQVPIFPLLSKLGWNKNKKLFHQLCLVSFIALFFTILLVSNLRDVNYDGNVNLRQASQSIIKQEQPKSFRPKLLQQLFINRWVGLEGAMAISSFPDRNLSAFFGILFEPGNRKNGDFYQEVSRSKYSSNINSQHNFRSLPGVVGFLYMSGSLAFVFCGMIFISLLINIFDRVSFFGTRNPLLSSLVGVSVAYVISLFGMDIGNSIFYLLTLLIVIFLVYILQSGLIKSIPCYVSPSNLKMGV